MKSCTIIISHYESLPFLRKCIRQIQKYQNPEVEQEVLILDQSCSATFKEAVRFCADIKMAIQVHPSKPLYSGYGIDNLLHNEIVDNNYICQLHADAFPIHKNWLLAPITLMEENNLAFSGLLQFVCDKPEAIYPFKNPFFAMAQCFNIGRTDVYKEMSLEGGFTRFHNRPQSGLTFNNNDWAEWAKEDYQARGSDDDVPAFYWEDTYREHDKLSFGLTGRIGIPGEESGYGTIIEDLVFHFGFHRESLGVMPQMGAKYKEWMRRINENYSDELIEEMLTEARKQKFDPVYMRKYWDGKLKKASQLASHYFEPINERIDGFVNGFLI